MENYVIITSVTIILGIISIIAGYFPLLKNFGNKSNIDANLSLFAIKAAFALIIGGFIIVILGLLYVMGVIH